MRIFRATARVILTGLACRHRHVDADTHRESASLSCVRALGRLGPVAQDQGLPSWVLVVSGERHARSDCTVC